MQAIALEINGLGKALGGRDVIRGLAMAVPRRSIYGFLGANGAGKTTTIRMVLGLMRADAGEIRLFGEPLRHGRARPIGALVESPALYDHLTGYENLDLTRRILGLRPSEVRRVLALIDIGHAAQRRVGTFSLGMRQRLGIARALLGSPRVLILDEPTNGLDPDGIRDMRELLKRLPESGDVTLMISSHLLNEIEAIATHVGLLHAGRMLAEAPLRELLGGENQVEVATGDRARAAAILAEAGLRVSALPASSDRLLVASSEPARIASLLHAQGEAVSHLSAIIVRSSRSIRTCSSGLLEEFHMLLRYLTVEILKLRRSLALLLCLAAPACIAILGALIVLDRGADWQTYTLSNAAFWAFAMLPLTLTALSVLLAQIEHGAKAWDHVLALPGARQNVYLAKALVMIGLLVGMSMWLFVLLHGAGYAIEAIAPDKLRGVPHPGATARILAEMAFASLLVAVLQLWVALRFRSFVPPLVFGIAGTFVALVAVGARQGLYFPWLMAVNVMGDARGQHATALLLGGGGGLLMLAAMCVMLARRDMVS